jgi:propanol-preferring alcohol dehydrogenase
MKKTMQAAVLTEHKQPLELREIPIPEPGNGEVLIEVEACGVCHTDVHIWKGDHTPSKDLPLILGHEGIGRIVANGSPQSKLKVDTRVGGGYIYSTCGICRECLTGYETHCTKVKATGFDYNGCFAQYFCLKEDWVTPIPDNINPIEFAPLMCAGVAAYSAVRKAEIEPGRLAAIFGCGGLGYYAIQFAKLYGARVVAVDINDEKLRHAEKLGADFVIRANDDPPHFIQNLGGADACLNFAPSLETWQQMLSSARSRAVIVLIALPKGEVSFEMGSVVENGLRIKGSADGTRQELRDLVALAESKRIFSFIESLPFSEVNKALERLSTGGVLGRLVLDMSKV